jgi:ADP-ribosylglycohydrolase
MSMDLARSILMNNGVDQDHLSESFAASYHWSRGYGPATAEILKYIKRGRSWYEVNELRYAEGSMGNGAAMRAPILSLCYPYDQHLLMENVIKASEITDTHPLAIESAKLVSYTVLSCLNDMNVSSILKAAKIHNFSMKFPYNLEY